MLLGYEVDVVPSAQIDAQCIPDSFARNAKEDAALRFVMQLHEIGVAEKRCEAFGAELRLVGNEAFLRNGYPCLLEGHACLGAEGGDRTWRFALVSGTDTHDHLRPPPVTTYGRGRLWSPPLNGS